MRITFFSGDYRLILDSEEGISAQAATKEEAERAAWKRKLRYYQQNRDARVSSERNVMNFLKAFRVENIKSVKFVEPQFPQGWQARYCPVLIENFAEAMVESRKSSARGVADDLKKYCGIIVDY